LGAGTSNHPFTTKAAYARGSNSPTNLFPWRAAGKLILRRAGTTTSCSAALIKKGIAVTAAHCLVKFGTTAFYDSAEYVPALFDSTKPYGTFPVRAKVYPTVWTRGTDECFVRGIICANDFALVVLLDNAGTFTGWLGYASDGWGYFDSVFNQKATIVTQLGYPAIFDRGLRMIRTDSLGYFAEPNNVIIGSDQGPGSSGGPWLVNFGTDPSVTGSSYVQPRFNTGNRIVGVTSWGYTDGAVKVLGASRF
jgi:V8-like Glu-specific endopeptidase